MKTLALLLALLFALSFAPDADAKTKRNAKAKQDFRRENPCPATGEIKGACPGYAIDHIVPLKCGGKDHPGNMQWLLIGVHKQKHKGKQCPSAH